jgi:hypothetical protein
MLADHLKPAVTSSARIIHFGADSGDARGELYRSDTLCVRAWPGRDSSRWFITFDQVGDDFSLDRVGFGEGFFRARGISLITVVGRGNDWYQYADTSQALDAVRRALEGTRTRIAYGSSMGGYAAVRFADAIGATACLALSPQYSNDPAKVPFEQRWRQAGTSIRWREELSQPIRCRISPILIYDSRDDDARHAALIATDTRLTPIAIPYAGHPTGTYLSSAGLLTPLIEALHAEDLDLAAFEQMARERRKTAAAWIGELARRQPPHRGRIAERLARDALSRLPDSDLLTHILAEILVRKGAYGEALQLHRRAYDLSGQLVVYGIPYSQLLLSAGFPSRALGVALDLQERFPQSESLSKWIAELHFRMGNLDRAIEQAAERLDAHPDETAHYRALLRRREAALRKGRMIRSLLAMAWRLVRSGFSARRMRQPD